MIVYKYRWSSSCSFNFTWEACGRHEYKRASDANLGDPTLVTNPSVCSWLSPLILIKTRDTRTIPPFCGLKGNADHTNRGSKRHPILARTSSGLSTACLLSQRGSKSADPVIGSGTMDEGRAKYWGKIKEVDAQRAESILATGEKEMPTRIPFVYITVTDSPEIQTVKESVEGVNCILCIERWRQALIVVQTLVGQEVRWGLPTISQDWTGNVPGTSNGQVPGIVVLSDMDSLPWEKSGKRGDRGGIYTWDRITFWTCKAGNYFLLFHISAKDG